MKTKKVMALLLVAAVTASMFAACGGASTAEEETPAGAGEAVAEDTSAEAEEDSFEGFEDLQTISGYGMSFMGEAGFAEVEDAINEITRESINVEIDYHPMDVATYMEQMGLMLAGGEAFDLIQCTAIPVVSFSVMQSQNELLDITDLLEEYGQGAKAAVGDYIDATTVDGKIYGIPNYKMYNSNYYMFMRKDVLDELGLTDKARSASSWTEIEEILLAVKDAQDTLPDDLRTNAILSNSDAQGCVISDLAWFSAPDKFADGHGMDVLANSAKPVYIDETDNTVKNFFASEEYRAQIERAHKFYEEGLIYKDAATSSETGDTLMQNGITFAYCTQCELGAEYSKTKTTGREVVAVEYGQIPVQTYNVNCWGWAVPVTSENPEAAVAFLNEMYTNPDLENLMVYGIEGRDYELNDAGEAVGLPDQQYHCEDFLFPNQFLAYPGEGNGSDFRDQALESLNNAEVSPYYGMTVNTDPIANELTAVSVALKKYEAGLESGSADPADLDKMLAELEDAGMQKVIDYYQSCLDEWLASK